jgi:hypothetical protein
MSMGLLQKINNISQHEASLTNNLLIKYRERTSAHDKNSYYGYMQTAHQVRRSPILF